MADAKKNILTYAGLQELEAELEDLKVNKRKEVAQKIKEAREQGDLSENAEYDAAKDEQREELDAYLHMLEEAAKRDHRKLGKELGLFVIKEEGPGFPFFLPKGMALRNELENFWREVHHDFEYDEDLEFSIVGSTQTNSLSGKISNESPLGHALIGHEVGDIVEVEMGDTVSKYKVLDIKKKK